MAFVLLLIIIFYRKLYLLMRGQIVNKYRHEYKYLCNSMQNAVMKMRAKGLLQVDRNAGDEGYYNIRSLYFDTPYNKCYYENENGVDSRDKYRIRIYNANANKIVLEKKSKLRQMTLKKSCEISRELCEDLMFQRRVQFIGEMPEVLRELLLEMQMEKMKPVVIVEYQRYPFVNKNGNVRITFDEHIRTSHDIEHFLDEKIITRPILEMGKSVLEIKWDEFLPSYIEQHMQTGNLQWTSFSKYYLCRKYNAYGGIK